MCGIVGYSGKKHNAKDVLISGLRNLEYRGYDSAGLALYEKNNINLYKTQGKISALEKLVENDGYISTCGIGHTRWATHGIPNEINAHPHKYGNVYLVHNGIIENYTELKEELKQKGYTFNTETDSEVACAYINYIYETQKDKIKCLIQACSQFRGSYAFGIMFDDEPNTLYATRKDSPLIIGKGVDENFICSDISAILQYTNKYILLEYDEFAKISDEKIEIFDNKEHHIEKNINIADWDITLYKKSGYDHYMLKEIYEQPEVLQNIFKRYFKSNYYEQNIDMSKFDNIHIVACGSAMHAGLIGKFLFETYANIPVTVEVSSEYRYKNQLITNKTLVIIVSQSGETADTLAALRIAKQKNAYTLAIVNVVGSTISREADSVIYTYAGPEIAVATTKGYISQVAILSTLVLNLSKQKDILSKDLENEVIKDYTNIYETLENSLKENKDKFSEIAKSIYTRNDLFYIGRGIDYAISMEGSLKLKEISYMHSESYAAGELKHGTISLIENGTPVIAIATDENLYEKTISNIKETKSRGSFVILITTEKLCKKFIDNKSQDFYDILLTVPDSTAFTQALITVPMVQLIAYETAILRKCDIDKPRNLAKSVTVE